MAYVISPDDIKEALPGYTPGKAENVHGKSIEIANRQFKNALKTRSERTVILLCCGGASGKSEYIENELGSKKAIIHDGTLSTRQDAYTKIRNIKRYKKKCVIVAVIVDSLAKSFHAFINRDRQYPHQRFYETHSGCRAVLKKVRKKYPYVEIHIIESYTDGYEELKFRELTHSREFNIDNFIDSIQTSTKEIQLTIRKELENEQL